MNYVAKLGQGFQVPPGPAASMDVVANYLHTAWLWEQIRVQVRGPPPHLLPCATPAILCRSWIAFRGLFVLRVYMDAATFCFVTGGLGRVAALFVVVRVVLTALAAL